MEPRFLRLTALQELLHKALLCGVTEKSAREICSPPQKWRARRFRGGEQTGNHFSWLEVEYPSAAFGRTPCRQVAFRH
jgi:hypothetical protein